MAARNRKLIKTNRGQLILNPTVIGQSGAGSVDLTAGASGNVSSITVDGVEVMSGTEVFDTDLDATARNIVDNINDFVSTPNYHARLNLDGATSVVRIFQVVPLAGTLTVASTTSVISTTDSDVINGTVGDGTFLGFTVEGLELDFGDEYLEEPTEETGAGMGAQFFLGGDPQITITLKQWDEDVLALRFQERHSSAGGGNRIQIPGTLEPGDNMFVDNPVVLELRPDDHRNETVLIRKAVFNNATREPTRFRTQEPKFLGLSFRCYPDEALVDGRAPYRTVGIDQSWNLTL